MSGFSPLSGVMRKSHFRAVKTVFDPTRKSALVQQRPDML